MKKIDINKIISDEKEFSKTVEEYKQFLPEEKEKNFHLVINQKPESYARERSSRKSFL